MAPGVFMLAGAVKSLDRRERHLAETRAMVLAYGNGWHAARRTAAVLHGLPLLGQAPEHVQLTRDRSGNRAHSTSRHHRIHALPAHETTVKVGMPTTNLARTVFDIGRGESFRSGVVVADAALRCGLARDELLAVLGSHRGWPGSRRARAAIEFADGRAESPLESLGRISCLEENLPIFEPQVEVWNNGEFVARTDGLWPESLVVFEGDGASKFTDKGALPALLTRQERIREAGMTVVRASWADVTHRRAKWAAGVRRELQMSGRQLAPGVILISTQVRATPLDASDHYRWPALHPLTSATPHLDGGESWLRRGVA